MDAPDRPSVLSHGEREVAARHADGESVEDIARARDEPVEAVEKALDRIRGKTDRALVTLLQSPFTAEVAADLDPESRDRLRARLDPEE